MIAKQTTYAMAPTFSLKDTEFALKDVRNDGAPDDATVTFLLGGYGVQIKAEWDTEVPDHAEPAADEREQPTQAEPDSTEPF